MCFRPEAALDIGGPSCGGILSRFGDLRIVPAMTHYTHILHLSLQCPAFYPQLTSFLRFPIIHLHPHHSFSFPFFFMIPLLLLFALLVTPSPPSLPLSLSHSGVIDVAVEASPPTPPPHSPPWGLTISF